MTMYNLLEYSDNYSMPSGSLWNYYKDEVNDDTNENNAALNKINNNQKIASKSFKYKTTLKGSTRNNNNILEAEVIVPLKYLSNFWRFVDFSWINSEIKLNLSWSKECIIFEILITRQITANPDDANPPFQEVAAIQATEETFK